jgi:hypothetical protein
MAGYRAEREDFGRKAFPPPAPHKLENLRGPGYSNIVVRGFLLQGACDRETRTRGRMQLNGCPSRSFFEG